MPMRQTRRRFLATLALGGTTGLVRPRPALAAEGAPEITSVRIQKSPSICNAPRYVAQELLRAEGFADIRYVSITEQGFTGSLDRGNDGAASG
jgi:NitT/TauT family transport system substrate-binding protein